MKIEQSIEVRAPVDRVWAFFDDVPRVASCMPGATLTEIVDDKTFDGDVAIKVGPVGVKYQGRLIIEEKDEASHTVRLNASGRDRKGAGTARATIVAKLTAVDAQQTKLDVDSDVQLTGRVASLGRGVQDVAGKIFAQFGEQMSAEITSGEQTESAKPVSADPTVAASLEGAGQLAAGGISTANDGANAAQHSPGKAAPVSATSRPTLTSQPGQRNKPIKAGGLLWSILKDKLARLFRRNRDRK